MTESCDMPGCAMRLATGSETRVDQAAFGQWPRSIT